jgi:glycosyltransferase 2 family protein
MSLAVVFILATLLGFASHAPGSLGVFDAAMLVALPQFGREQLLATLLVFRVLYFVIPFTIAISIMGTRELWLNVVMPWRERRRLSGNCSPSMQTPMPTSQPQPVPAPAVVPRMHQRRQSKG